MHFTSIFRGFDDDNTHLGRGQEKVSNSMKSVS